MLLLAVTGEKKSNLNGGFKLEPVTTNNLPPTNLI